MTGYLDDLPKDTYITRGILASHSTPTQAWFLIIQVVLDLRTCDDQRSYVSVPTVSSPTVPGLTASVAATRVCVSDIEYSSWYPLNS